MRRPGWPPPSSGSRPPSTSVGGARPRPRRFSPPSDDDGLFTVIPLDAALDGHQLFVGPVPHLYPLVRLIDQHPRYAALLVD